MPTDPVSAADSAAADTLDVVADLPPAVPEVAEPLSSKTTEADVGEKNKKRIDRGQPSKTTAASSGEKREHSNDPDQSSTEGGTSE